MADIDPADLQIAEAALAGDPDALAELDAGPLAGARAHLASLGFAPDAVDEAAQRGRIKLVVEGGLASYRGLGSLASFVRTVVVRIAIDRARAARPDAELDIDIEAALAAPSADPELEYMRKLYATELAAATRDAWSRLAPHERFVLTLRLRDALSIDDLARVYKISRASAARRAASARASLITHTRASLRDRLGVGEATLDSVLRIVTTSIRDWPEE